jgi:hypothetical protein
MAGLNFMKKRLVIIKKVKLKTGQKKKEEEPYPVKT